MRRCPKCNREMNASAIVEVFPEPAGWDFYGPERARFIRCRGQVGGRGFIHFYIRENGREYHRLAYGIEREVEAAPVAVQERLL